MILALGQVILGAAHARTLTQGKGIVCSVELRVDAATLAHLDHARGIGGGEHRVLACEFLGDAVNRGLGTKERATFDAGKRLFLVQHHLGQG